MYELSHQGPAVIELTHKNDILRVRRLALQAQGLLQVKPFGTGLAAASRAIMQLGYLQLDSISVVERAHHHVLYSRVPNYKPAMLDELLVGGDIFEYWSHAAAFLPMADYRFSLPYKQAIKHGQTHWFKNPDKKLMTELLARIRSEGPLRARDLESGANKAGGWWDWKPAKRALEQLYMQGDVMVRDREGFQKNYDLTERVLPENVNRDMPTLQEFATHLLEQQLRCHGLLSLKGITYLRRNPGLRSAVKALVNTQLEAGVLTQFKLPNGEVFLIPPQALEGSAPRANKRMQILSPFDNAVIQRDRLQALFQFDYQIECYVPEAKRQYGYFCLPLLYGDEFVGRMDCKVHRKDRHLEIKALHFEAHKADEEVLVAALVKALQPFRQFQQCDTVSFNDIYPKHLTAALRASI